MPPPPKAAPASPTDEADDAATEAPPPPSGEPPVIKAAVSGFTRGTSVACWQRTRGCRLTPLSRAHGRVCRVCGPQSKPQCAQTNLGPNDTNNNNAPPCGLLPFKDNTPGAETIASFTPGTAPQRANKRKLPPAASNSSMDAKAPGELFDTCCPPCSRITPVAVHPNPAAPRAPYLRAVAAKISRAQPFWKHGGPHP